MFSFLASIWKAFVDILVYFCFRNLALHLISHTPPFLEAHVFLCLWIAPHRPIHRTTLSPSSPAFLSLPPRLIPVSVVPFPCLLSCVCRIPTCRPISQVHHSLESTSSHLHLNKGPQSSDSHLCLVMVKHLWTLFKLLIGCVLSIWCQDNIKWFNSMVKSLFLKEKRKQKINKLNLIFFFLLLY